MRYRYLTIVGILLYIFALPYVDQGSTSLDEAREASSEQYLLTDIGITRYQVFGKANDEVVILVAASNGYLEQWNPNVEPLVNAGYKVVTYDLLGRGLSDRPNVNLDLSVFRNQLSAIIGETAGAKKVHLIGSSFGSIIASDYALNNRSRVQKMIFIGPAGWPSDINSASLLLNIPVLGEFIFHYFGETLLMPRVEGYFYNKKKGGWAINMWQKFAHYPGFMRTYLSTLRHSPVLDYTEGWKKLGSLNKPIQFIWGKEDVSFPFSNSSKAAALIPQAKIVGIEKAAHWVNIDQPELVNKAITLFLQE